MQPITSRPETTMSEELTPGKRIKEVRKELGITQDQFAETLGVTRVVVNRWESGKQEPSETIVKFVDLIATLKPGRDWVRLHAPKATG
jgi:DNA-binding transcriptional regulator YiaG